MRQSSIKSKPTKQIKKLNKSKTFTLNLELTDNEYKENSKGKLMDVSAIKSEKESVSNSDLNSNKFERENGSITSRE